MRVWFAAILLASAAGIACAQGAAPVARDRQAALAMRDAAELDAALARGDTRRARDIEKRIGSRPAGTLPALEQQAAAGLPAARFAAGLFLARGLLVARDEARACEYFGQAAEGGNAAAAYHAALCLLARDPARAARLMQSAAARRHPAAQEAIGRACLEERGERNLGCAVRNLAAAAKAGRPSAQSLFAWMHAMGVGVEREPVTALALYLIAAGKGDLAAQNNLGELYETGAESALEKNPRRAALWYEAAARGGFGPAQYNLGRLYAQGAGVEYNAAAARFWLELAEQRGVASAAELLRRLDAEPSAAPR